MEKTMVIKADYKTGSITISQIKNLECFVEIGESWDKKSYLVSLSDLLAFAKFKNTASQKENDLLHTLFFD